MMGDLHMISKEILLLEEEAVRIKNRIKELRQKALQHKEPDMVKPVGNHTGKNGSDELLEKRSGWPTQGASSWEGRLKGRRFDEPGMEVKFKSPKYA